VICQAGGSARGKQFAAEWAETILCAVRGVEAMKAYRDDVRRRAVAAGRDPDTVEVVLLISPIVDVAMARRHVAVVGPSSVDHPGVRTSRRSAGQDPLEEDTVPSWEQGFGRAPRSSSPEASC
jgi:alkanesulfonate monooxygenase SsuD/methylene tetrahydromethanopterin reductase-like flavin-dependent oxidoreductase (luciferase family)